VLRARTERHRTVLNALRAEKQDAYPTFTPKSPSAWSLRTKDIIAERGTPNAIRKCPFPIFFRSIGASRPNSKCSFAMADCADSAFIDKNQLLIGDSLDHIHAPVGLDILRITFHHLAFA
jgi:hypothetical protein